MTEAQIQREIIKFLRSIGGAVWHTSQGFRRDPGGTRMTPGLPDLVVMFPEAWRKHVETERPGFTKLYLAPDGRWTFAEVKTPKGRLSPAQIVFRDESAKAGVPWELWRSVEDAAAWARALGIVE